MIEEAAKLYIEVLVYGNDFLDILHFDVVAKQTWGGDQSSQQVVCLDHLGGSIFHRSLGFHFLIENPAMVSPLVPVG